jgi:hypothetical protein
MRQSLLETLDALANSGALGQVQYIVFNKDPDFVTGIVLEFDSKKFSILVKSEDDTLEILTGEAQLERNSNLKVMTDCEPWRTARRAIVRWVWKMTNHKGYFDGIQLEFMDPNTTSVVLVIQFIAVASSLSFRLVKAARVGWVERSETH